MAPGTTAASPRFERENYLGVVRLALALLVLYSHSFSLAGDPREPIALLNECIASLGKVGAMLLYANSLGQIAVDTFFVISGYLITQSWLRSPSAEEFVVKRVARIYPGYWVAFAFSLLVGTIFSRPAGLGYLQQALPHRSAVLTGLLFLDHHVLNSGLAFRHNPSPYVVNGSLWTLPVELNCYLLVLALGSFSLLKRSRGLVVAFVVVLLGVGINAVLSHDATLTFWRFLFDFLAGTMAFLYGDSLPNRPALVAWSLYALVACLLVPVLFPMLYPVCVAYLLLRFGFRRPPAILRWKADLSYGVYIYAFPVQQACMATLHLPASGLLLTLVSAPIVLALAWLSWNYVEQPAIARFRGGVLRRQRATSAYPAAQPAPQPQDIVADAPAFG